MFNESDGIVKQGIVKQANTNARHDNVETRALTRTHPYAVQGSGLISQETENAGVGVPQWQRRSLRSRMQSEVNQTEASLNEEHR